MPDRIGKYEIRGEIGKGGFGKVYLGYDPTVSRLVAIKVLSSGGDPSTLARFRTEAAAAGKLNHKNIVTVFEFGEDHGTFYLVMQYLEGHDLQHVMPRANTIGLVDKMNIMTQVAEGLQCAHQHGIVHRDVKPANIMLLADGTVKIMDFGIARLTHANSARLTQSGFLIGTLSYMAPELLNGQEADALCDIWAFGTIYYELLSGQHPFESNDTAAAMYRIMSWEPPRIRSIFPECPEALDNVIFRLLTKDRESRYQNFEDVLFDTTPILLELESQQAGRLVSQAQQLIGLGRLEEAEPVIKQILALDPAHQEGRALRKELQSALKKRTVQSRVVSFSEQSEKFAAANNFVDAVRAMENAAAVDPSNESLSLRLKELQAAKERFERAQQFLAQARTDFAQGNLTSAFQSASDALHAEPGSLEARGLRGEIQQRMTERDSDRRLREGLSNVKGLIALQAFDEAIAQIETLMQQGCDSVELRELLRSTRQQNEDFQRDRRIRAEIEAAKDAIKNRRFEEAVTKLQPLESEPTCKAEVSGLLAYAREELAVAERAVTIKNMGKEAYALLKAKDFDAALTRVEAGLKMFPDEGMLLKLRQAVVSERAQEEHRNAIRQALEESATLDRSGQWEQAMAPLEKALWQFPDDARLRTALDQAKKKREEQKKAARLAALDEELKRARHLLEGGKPDSATRLLQDMTVSYPGEAAVKNLLDVARAEEERRSGIETLCAEVRQSLQRKRPEEAIEAIARGKMQFGLDPQLLTLELEAERTRARKEALEQATQASRVRNWTLAEKALEGMLAQDGTDTEARNLLEEVRQEHQAEQRQQLRDNGRKEAAKLLQSNRFDDAIRVLRGLCDQLPEDGAIREDLREALETKERQSRRDAYAQGRQQAEALVRTGKFDAAIAAIEKLLVQFPQDATLQEDERAAKEAKLQQERRSRYNSERQRAAELVRNRKFDEAIQALETMSQQFPGDPGIEEDLRSAQAAKGLQTERFEVNQRVAKLEQYYRQGKPEKVKELAVPLLAKLEEPRARELLDWAEATLSRPPSGIEPGVPAPPSAAKRYAVWAGVGVVLLAIVGLLIFALHNRGEGTSPTSDVAKVTPGPSPQPNQSPAPPAPEPSASPSNPPTGNKETPRLPPDPRVTVKLTLDPDQVTFEWQIGTANPGPRTVAVHASGTSQKWKATVNKGDNWLVVVPGGESSFSVVVDPTKLGRGSYSSVIVVSLDQAQANLSVRLTVNPAAVAPQPPPQPQPQAQPPPLQPMTDCGPGYSRKKQETLIWNGDLKPGAALVLGLRSTVIDGGGRIESYGLPGCDVTIEDLTSGLTIEEKPTAQNQFQRMKLRNTSGRSIGSVSFDWKVTMK